MKGFLARFTKAGRSQQVSDDDRFGTGLWRHNRDRFLRAVDRYYTTALALHEARNSGDIPQPGPASAVEDPNPADDGNGGAASAQEEGNGASTDPIDVIVDGTHRLNALVPVVDDITAGLHAAHPVTGQIVPGPVRRAVGDAPELLTKASSKVAEAVLAASMARAEAPAGKPNDSSARATERFISDAADLLERARAELARLERS
ncbi:hypothetical protein [Brevibacterium oceani]|uniref:hypothetical protein n=1 Tax=Brevibacterium oceani TaxID=358099 RepID=UPI0015E70143|nr:hypothetical protein [Brevibacterium oceani]